MQFVEQLLELPLLLGMSRSDLNDVAGQTKFGFLRVSGGKGIATEGETCDCLYLLMRGEVEATAWADDRSYRLVERMAAPSVFQPECLFGMTTRFTKTYAARTDCQLIRLDKQEVMRLCTDYEVFRINLLNMVCTVSQRNSRQSWRIRPQDIRQKIGRFVEMHSSRPAGWKQVYVKMDTLAKAIGESRLNLSRELNRMDAEGLIALHRGGFTIEALERLLN